MAGGGQMKRPTVIDWDSTVLPAELRALLPSELRELPPGRYLVEPIADDDELTDEEEAGIIEAIEEIEAGRGIPWEDALQQIRARGAE